MKWPWSQCACLLQINPYAMLNLLSQTFPRPALQMEFTAWLPWILDEQRDTLAPPPLVQKNEEEEEQPGTIDNLFL